MPNHLSEIRTASCAPSSFVVSDVHRLTLFSQLQKRAPSPLAVPFFYPNQFLARLYNSNRTHSVINIVLFLLAVLRLWFRHFSGQKFDFTVIIKAQRSDQSFTHRVFGNEPKYSSNTLGNNAFETFLSRFFATVCY